MSLLLPTFCLAIRANDFQGIGVPQHTPVEIVDVLVQVYSIRDPRSFSYGLICAEGNRGTIISWRSLVVLLGWGRTNHTARAVQPSDNAPLSLRGRHGTGRKATMQQSPGYRADVRAT